MSVSAPKRDEPVSVGASKRGEPVRAANPCRGEANLVVAGETLVLRPSFAALVAAEEELGPLFALVEQASEGRLALAQVAALFDHLSATRPAGIGRAAIGEAVVEQGLVAVAPIIKLVLAQILQGR